MSPLWVSYRSMTSGLSLKLYLIRWCIIETSSGLPRKSSAIFGNLRTSSEIFGKCSGTFVWYSEQFWKMKWRVIIAVIFQFKQLERRNLKKSGLQRDSNPWPPRYRCDALPTELWSHTLGARSIYWVHIFPCSEVMWSIYEIIHILYCGCIWSEEWSSQ